MFDLEQHLATHIRSGGKTPLAECALVYWEAFIDLHGTRQWHAAGAPLAITYAEILAYMDAMRMPFSPYQVALIRKMDQAYLETQAAGSKAGQDRRSDTPLTPALFDAVIG